jgi:hypothetical protein
MSAFRVYEFESDDDAVTDAIGDQTEEERDEAYYDKRGPHKDN